MKHSIVFFLGFLSVAVVQAGHYHIAIKGAFTCNNTIYSGAHIELFDYDFFYPDVKLSEVVSGKNGKFYIEGDRYEFVPMIPYFQVSETCRGSPACWKFWVPQDYQWTDGYPRKIYHVGNINLTDPSGEGC
ncbi:hypothetical protein M3Y95_00618500 [Aphelenchoides besseyi]|nr:hypothetical protein M3Y95_00618500 [Aphelenchoides besseyi]